MKNEVEVQIWSSRFLAPLPHRLHPSWELKSTLCVVGQIVRLQWARRLADHQIYWATRLGQSAYDGPAPDHSPIIQPDRVIRTESFRVRFRPTRTTIMRFANLTDIPFSYVSIMKAHQGARACTRHEATWELSQEVLYKVQSHNLKRYTPLLFT